MLIVNCKSMRLAVTLAAGLFAVGVIFQVPALLAQGNSAFALVILSFLGLAAMALGLTTILLTAAMALLPAVSKRLDACQH